MSCVFSSLKSKRVERDTCIIGDVHGCYEELLELMEMIGFHHSKMRLIFAGDYGDRGPNSLECVRYIRNLCEKGEAEAIMGNHDRKHFRYRAHEIAKALSGKENPMNAMSPIDLEFQRSLSEADIAWLRQLPLKIHIKNNWWVIHGGLEPAFDFEHQSPDQIIRCRYVSDGSHITSSGKTVPKGRAVPLNKDKSQPANTFYWTQGWNGPQSIVYGHCVHSLHTPLIDKKPHGIMCVGIDTGCVFGGFLTGFFLEKGEFVKVKAKRAYSNDFNLEE